MIDYLNSADSRFLYDLSQSQARTTRAQDQLSSGYRVAQASDDPTVAAKILQTASGLVRTQQTQENLGQVKDEVDGAEQALQNAVSLVDQARVAAVQGANSTQTAASRQVLADQVGSVLTSLVQVANTQVNGRYVFSGDSDQTPAYTIDLTQASPVSAYQGSAATRQVQDASGTAFPIARSAQEIFDSSTSGQNVLTSLVALRTALLNNDQPGVATALTGAQSAADFLNTEHATYGGYQDRVLSAQSAAQSQVTSLTVQLSNLRDADITQAALEVNEGNLAVQTALTAHSKVSQKSLFDYLA